MATKKTKKAPRVRPSRSPVQIDEACDILASNRYTDKKRYSRSDVDKMIAEALPDRTVFDILTQTKSEYDNMLNELGYRQRGVKDCEAAVKEIEKRLKEAHQAVLDAASKTLP